MLAEGELGLCERRWAGAVEKAMVDFGYDMIERAAC